MDATANKSQKRLRRQWTTIIALVVLAPPALYWSWLPDSRITIEKLRGLTPDQVVARLGSPRHDPRKPQLDGWTPAQEPQLGPLMFGYYDYSLAGREYLIIFEDNKVVEVRTGTK